MPLVHALPHHKARGWVHDAGHVVQGALVVVPLLLLGLLRLLLLLRPTNAARGVLHCAAAAAAIGTSSSTGRSARRVEDGMLLCAAWQRVVGACAARAMSGQLLGSGCCGGGGCGCCAIAEAEAQLLPPCRGTLSGLEQARLLQHGRHVALKVNLLLCRHLLGLGRSLSPARAWGHGGTSEVWRPGVG